MDPPSPSDAMLQRRIHQQEVVADLGQQALAVDVLGNTFGSTLRRASAPFVTDIGLDATPFDRS